MVTYKHMHVTMLVITSCGTTILVFSTHWEIGLTVSLTVQVRRSLSLLYCTDTRDTRKPRKGLGRVAEFYPDPYPSIPYPLPVRVYPTRDIPYHWLPALRSLPWWRELCLWLSAPLCHPLWGEVLACSLFTPVVLSCMYVNYGVRASCLVVF